MTGEFTAMEGHPGLLPGVKATRVKLIFSGCSGVILGAELSGGDCIGEMINLF